MKKIGLISLLAMIVLILGAGSVLAHHQTGHDPVPRCSKPTTGSGKVCYPPPQSQSSGSGQPASFTTDAPQQSGITVGLASVIALGGVGTLLIVRRRWMFRTSRG